jgi:hypothetical protein
MTSSMSQTEPAWSAVEVRPADDISTTEATSHHSYEWSTVLAVGAPLTLAIVEVFHPHSHDLMIIDVPRWLMVHYTQLVLFPLAALSQTLLIRGRTGYAAGLCRVAMFVFGVSYVSFDTAAGLVTGVLIRIAHASGTPELWRGPLLAIWTHAVIGGNPDGAPVLAVVGTIAWLVGSLGAAIAVWRPGYSWWPSAFLVVSAFGLFVFRTHAWPGGPVTFGALAVAVFIMQSEARRRASRSR